jgi:hypothetical protein
MTGQLQDGERIALHMGPLHRLTNAAVGLLMVVMGLAGLWSGPAFPTGPVGVLVHLGLTVFGGALLGLAGYLQVTGRPLVELTEDGVLDHRLGARVRGRTFIPWEEVDAVSRAYTIYGAQLARLELLRGPSAVYIGLAGSALSPGEVVGRLRARVNRPQRARVPGLRASHKGGRDAPGNGVDPPPHRQRGWQGHRP